MHKTPAFTAPVFYRDPAAALSQVQRIYQQGVDFLRVAMRDFVAGADFSQTRVRACYPFVRLHTHSVSHNGGSRLSYGFVAGPGRFETTITRPDLYADYLLQQFGLLLANHGGELEVGISAHPIPIHFSFAEHDHVEGSLSSERRASCATCLICPTWPPWTTASPTAPGTSRARARRSRYRCSPRRAWTTRCTACATTRARRPSGSRTSVLFTNYQFYIDEFVQAWATPRWPSPDSEYIAFIEPGNVVTRRVGPGCPARRRTGRSHRRACRRCPATTSCAQTAAASPWSTSAWAPANAKTITGPHRRVAPPTPG